MVDSGAKYSEIIDRPPYRVHYGPQLVTARMATETLHLGNWDQRHGVAFESIV